MPQAVTWRSNNRTSVRMRTTRPITHPPPHATRIGATSVPLPRSCSPRNLRAMMRNCPSRCAGQRTFLNGNHSACDQPIQPKVVSALLPPVPSCAREPPNQPPPANSIAVMLTSSR